MRVSVLAILHRGKDHITIHEDDAQAWAELVHFVDSWWSANPETADTPRPTSEDDRVRLFFAAPDASYILGNADVSELEAHVGAVLAVSSTPFAPCTDG